ncbi:metal-dependent hydrolase [Halopenitus sp. H-Gu1]|uniref:metal-dependent hydrolase n=1 Tax=Halopenitus sp. H-Gu1 TaxID=3242697 RepID=UPI00359D3500
MDGQPSADQGMMAPTHVVVGPVLALPLLAVSPELAATGALAGIVGGIVPDLDLFVGEHRKTLHYPVLYWIPTVPAVAIAALVPTTATVALALCLTAAAVHSVTDALGGARELAPWEATSDLGVYHHTGRRWIPPRRIIRYDGAPEDVALSFVLAVPGIFWFGESVRTAIAVALIVAAVYGLIRKRIPRYVEPIVE